MKLDRNITRPRRGKYALIKLRECNLPFRQTSFMGQNLSSSVPSAAIDYGDADSDFFVIRLKDKYAVRALRAYAKAARHDDPQYAAEVDKLAELSKRHPSKRRPD